MRNLENKIQSLLKFYQTKNYIKAESYNKQLIKDYPQVAFLYNILGLIFAAQEKFSDAISSYEKGLKIEPNNATIYNNIGTSYKLRGDHKLAEKSFKKSIDINDKVPEAYNNLGNLFQLLNKHNESIDFYRKALKIKGKSYISNYNIGVVYKSLGKFDESKKYLNKAISINQNFYPAHRSLSQIINYTKNNNHYKLLKKIYLDSSNKNEKGEIAFALGKAYEDIRDYEKSFKYYKEANKIHKMRIKETIIQEKIDFKKIQGLFTIKYINENKYIGNVDESPIFILGMPRSGTTLIEQILSSHPKVFGGGELDYFPELVKKNFISQFHKLDFSKLLLNQNELLEKIGEEYINKIKKISKNHLRITDKLPVNFKWIGLIKLALPKAKIIHCVRNSRDNCFSIYKNFFVNRELNYAYSLNDIVAYYTLYNNLMKYWKKLLPNFIYEIKYENLINNPKDQIRKLIVNCNLEWNDKCLQFHKNQRVIKTASDSQARKKIYKTSINSWKKYAKYLEKAFKSLP